MNILKMTFLFSLMMISTALAHPPLPKVEIELGSKVGSKTKKRNIKSSCGADSCDLRFGGVDVGASSHIIVIIEAADPDWETYDIHGFSGPAAPFVKVSDSCNSSLVGRSCTTEYSFTPLQVAARASVSAASWEGTYLDGEGGVVTVGGVYTYSLSGNGIEKPPQEPEACVGGSIIGPTDGTVREFIDIVGTPHSLFYSNLFSSAYKARYGVFESKFGFRQEGWTFSSHMLYELGSERLYTGTGDIQNRPYFLSETNEINVVSQDGGEIYIFTDEGKHLRTISSLTGALKFSFGYDTNERLVSIEDAHGNVTSVARNSTGSMSTITSPYGQVTTIAGNGDDLISSVTSPGGQEYILGYVSTDLLSQFQKPGGQISTMTYDVDGKLTKDVGHGGNFWEIIHSANLTSMGSKLGRTTLYDRSSTTNGISARIQTDPSGLITVSSEELGQYMVSASQLSTQETYKAEDERFGTSFDRVFYSEYTTGGTTVDTSFSEVVDWLEDAESVFDFSQIEKTAETGGRVFTEVFTKSDMTSTQVSPEGAVRVVRMDAFERPIWVQTGADMPVTFFYNSRGQLESSTQGVKNTNLYSYNTLGQLKTLINGRNEQTSFGYDLNGRVTSMVLPGSRSVLYQYDANGNITGITPPGRPMHEFSFNAMELPAQYSPPSVVGVTPKETVYQYNLDKQLTQIQRPNGKSATFNYNLTSGLLENITTTGGNYAYTYSTSKPGQVSQVMSPYAVKSVYSYHGAIPTGEEQFRDTNTLVGQVMFGLDSSLRVSSRTIKDASGASFIRNITLNDDDQPTQYGDMVMSYTYPSGRLETTTLGGVSDTRSYDVYGNLESYTAIFSPPSAPPQTLYSYTLSRDDMSRISGMSETIQGVTSTYEFGYDIAGRLIQLKKNGLVVGIYEYDANGNRISQTVNGKTVTSSFDDQDRIINFGGKTYSFDPNGDLLGTQLGMGATESYQYDVMGNLVSGVNTRGDGFEFLIDGRDRRVGKKSGTQTVQRFIYQDKLRVAAELDGSGLLKSEFIYATNGNSPDYMIRGGIKYGIIKNHLGSPRLIINAVTGALVQRIDYDIWGQVLRDSNTCFQPFGFAGGLRDPDHKLLRFGARDYDPEIGRFTSKDPVLFNGGDTNLYGYVMNDPVNFIDPLGLWSISVGGYLGIGGSVTIGQNPNGSYFGSIRGGVGVGGGASWDKHGSSPDGGTCGSVSTGQYAEGSAHFGPLEAVVGTSSGYSQSNGPYYNPPSFSGSVVPSIGVGAGVSGGFEVIFH